MRLLAMLIAALMVLALLPAAAIGQPRQAPLPGGAPDGGQSGTHRWPHPGPVLPGPEYIEPFTEIDNPDRSRRLVADAAGHLLIQGRLRTDDGVLERLVALNTADGGVDWVMEDIEPDCLPVATEDGRIFATLVANSDTSGVQNSSSDPVEIDAETGEITNRYTSPDDDVSPRLNECRNELRLGAGGILLSYTSADDYALVGIDSTTEPMTEAWRFTTPDTVNDSSLDRIVLSPDGQTVYLGSRPEDSDPPATRVFAVDVATGAEIARAVVPGTEFTTDGLAHTGDLLLVATEKIGGQDDPPRIIALDPETLDQQWVAEGGDDLPFDRPGRMAVTDETVVVHAANDLIGFSLDDGSQVWDVELSSFSNNGSQVVADAAGNVYTSTFGGSPLEIYDGATGARVFVSPDTDEYLGDAIAGELTLGPILDDGRFYGLTRDDDGNAVLIAFGNGNERLDGITGDPIDIAIQLCQYLFGDDRARTVVLARNDVFADTLAGAPLAGDHSCILFTPGGPDQPLDERTLEEIQRALPDGATVRIVGGTNAVSAQAEQAVVDAGFVVERLAGPSRIETAVAISDVVVSENDNPTAAIVAFAGNWPDAVTGGAAAAAQGIPVLLTGTDDLPAATAQALDRYGTTTTTVPGGQAVVSDAVFGQLPGAQRVAGPNRYATAAEVARTLWADLAQDGAFVLSNLEFELGWALALAASPLSVRLGAPQVGVRTTSLPAESEDYLLERGVTDPGLIVLGDLTVIEDDVITQVEATTS